MDGGVRSASGWFECGPSGPSTYDHGTVEHFNWHDDAVPQWRTRRSTATRHGAAAEGCGLTVLRAVPPLSATRLTQYDFYKRHTGGSYDCHPHQIPVHASCTALQLQATLMHVQKQAPHDHAQHSPTRPSGPRAPVLRGSSRPCPHTCMPTALAQQQPAHSISSRHQKRKPVRQGAPRPVRGLRDRMGCWAVGRRSPGS